MKRLKLRDCIVNSISLFNIASYCPNLEYLDVRSSTFPSEESFKYARVTTFVRVARCYPTLSNDRYRGGEQSCGAIVPAADDATRPAFERTRTATATVMPQIAGAHQAPPTLGTIVLGGCVRRMLGRNCILASPASSINQPAM